MGTHPIFESDFDCLTGSSRKLSSCRLHWLPSGRDWTRNSTSCRSSSQRAATSSTKSEQRRTRSSSIKTSACPCERPSRQRRDSLAILIERCTILLYRGNTFNIYLYRKNKPENIFFYKP